MTQPFWFVGLLHYYKTTSTQPTLKLFNKNELFLLDVLSTNNFTFNQLNCFFRFTSNANTFFNSFVGKQLLCYFNLAIQTVEGACYLPALGANNLR